MVFLSTAQHSTAQHSTAQHSTAQHSTAQQHVNLSKRAYLLCEKTESLTQTQAFSLINEKAFSVATNRKAVA